jgi:hypothetical protein
MSKLSRYLGATLDLKTASRAVVSVATLRHCCADELAQKAFESIARLRMRRRGRGEGTAVASDQVQSIFLLHLR